MLTLIAAEAAEHFDKQFPIQFQIMGYYTTYNTPSIPGSDTYECRSHKSYGHQTCGDFTFT